MGSFFTDVSGHKRPSLDAVKHYKYMLRKKPEERKLHGKHFNETVWVATQMKYGKNVTATLYFDFMQFAKRLRRKVNFP